MVAFVTASVVFVIAIAGVLLFMQRRPVGTPLTWGEAMLAATITLALMLLGYAIVPDRWLKLASDEWGWRKDSIAYRLSFWDRGRITITKEAIRDIIVVVIYGVMLGVHIFLWSAWQKRGRKQEAPPALETSTFGRPLVRKS